MKQSTLTRALLGLAMTCLPFSGAVGQINPTAPTQAQATNLFKQLPARFISNVGQWEHNSPFVADLATGRVFLEDRGWAISRLRDVQRDSAKPIHGVAVRMRFLGGNGSPLILPENKLPGITNYMIGNDRNAWRTEVPGYASVRYQGLYSGVDMLVKDCRKDLEYDLLLAPGADLTKIQIAVDGIEEMHLGADGALVFTTAIGSLSQPAPLTWEKRPDGTKRIIHCHYVLLGENRFGFTAPEWKGENPLVIDPVLSWSTFLGSGGTELVNDIAVDAYGVPTVVGLTANWPLPNFPVTSGAFQTSTTVSIGFVTRFSPTGGSLVYSTFLGGKKVAPNRVARSEVRAVALDNTGEATVAGYTMCKDFPVSTVAFDRTHNGENDGFVARLSESGAKLQYGTYLGTSASDVIVDLAINPLQMVTVLGSTTSTNFPMAAFGYDKTYNGKGDCFITRFYVNSTQGTKLSHSTYFGGSGMDNPKALHVGSWGVVVVGDTGTHDLPTSKPPYTYDKSYNGGSDVFAVRFDNSLLQLRYLTYLGSTGSDYATGVHMDNKGVVSICGYTTSAYFPTTTNAYTPKNNGNYEAFVTCIRTTTSTNALLYSTFLGGEQHDMAEYLVGDDNSKLYIVGRTHSCLGPLRKTFPTTTGAIQSRHASDNVNPFPRYPYDGFFSVIDYSLSGASSLVYSTYLGTTTNDSARTVAIDLVGDVYLGGYTNGSTFIKTSGAFDRTFNGGQDGFVMKVAFITPEITREWPPITSKWGRTTMNYPFTTNSSHKASRLMVMVSQSIPFNSGSVISKISLRRDTKNSAYLADSYGSLRARIGMTQRNPKSISHRFDANWYKSYYTTVYNGKLHLPLSPKPVYGTASYNVVIPFIKPWTYTRTTNRFSFLVDLFYTNTQAPSRWGLDALSLATDEIPGTTSTYGSGCRGSNGYVPSVITFGSSAVPGRELKIEVRYGAKNNNPADRIAINFLGISQVNFGGFKLPLNLAFMGYGTSCYLHTDMTLTQGVTMIPHPTGNYTMGAAYWYLPNIPELYGVKLYTQALCLDKAVFSWSKNTLSSAQVITFGRGGTRAYKGQSVYSSGVNGSNLDYGNISSNEFMPFLRFHGNFR